MKLLATLAAGLVLLLGLAVGFVWVTVPLNAPWRSMLQQAGVLPAWLDPTPISTTQVNQRLVAADGYGVSLFASDVPEARVLRVTTAGDVLVATPRDGRILLLEADRDGDGVSDGRRIVLEELNRPNGLDIADRYLYVAEEDGIGRVEFDAEAGTVHGMYHRIVNGLPAGGNHWRKTIRVGPDGLLYVAVGSSCNVCLEEDERRAALLRYTPEGAFVDLYATGLRNSAGFDWSPSGVLYATDNGRDLLGDDFPPCELNAIVDGGFYGWPFANGSRIADPDLGTDRDHEISRSLPPVHEFRAHNAPLGIAFLRHERHPRSYRGAAVVALHGSWNRTEKDGYKVVSLHFSPDGTVEERDFLTGFLHDDVAIGRPAEVDEGPDGSVYVSDDLGSAVYQIRYGAQQSALAGAVTRTVSVGYDPSAIDAREREAAHAVGAEVVNSEDCLSCHTAPPSDDPSQILLENLAARYTVDELVDLLTTPPAPMPPYEAGPEARRALAIYLLETY